MQALFIVHAYLYQKFIFLLRKIQDSYLQYTEQTAWDIVVAQLS